MDRASRILLILLGSLPAILGGILVGSALVCATKVGCSFGVSLGGFPSVGIAIVLLILGVAAITVGAVARGPRQGRTSAD